MERLNFLHIVTLSAMAILGITSCSEDQETEKAPSSKDMIRFSVADADGTRSAMDSENFKKELKGFYVYAFSDDASQKPYMDDVEFVNDGTGSFTYKDKGMEKFWPDFPLNFVAMNAHDVLDSKLEITSQGVVGLGVFRGGEKDIVAAYVPNQNKRTNNGEVFLQFHHLLSQVKFYVEDCSTSRLDFEINKIGLKGVYDDAFFGIDREGNVKTYIGPSGYAAGNYSIDVKDYQADREPVLLNHGKELFLVPYNHKVWDPKSGVKIQDINEAFENDDDKNIYSYVWIECKVKKDGHYIVGDDNTYGHTYFPFKVNLKAGKLYNYIIRISDDFYGYTDESETRQEPKLGWIMTTEGNVYPDFGNAVSAGESPVAMIAYINPSWDGPGPYRKHGLAISLNVLGKTNIGPNRIPDLFFTLEELDKFYTYVGDNSRSVGHEPNWTQWYVPSCKDFDLIFQAFGGTPYSQAKHYDNQPWSYGNLNNELRAIEDDVDEVVGLRGFSAYVLPFMYNFDYTSYGRYIVRKEPNSFLNNVMVYNAVDQKYVYKLYEYNNIRLVFKF